MRVVLTPVLLDAEMSVFAVFDSTTVQGFDDK